MRIVKKPMSKTVKAAEDIDNVPVDDNKPVEVDPQDSVEVAPEATELLFETEDVAQLLAEVTDSEVTVDTDDNSDDVTFTVDNTPYVVSPEGDEELLESSKKIFKGAKNVSASKVVRRGARRRIK